MSENKTATTKLEPTVTAHCFKCAQKTEMKVTEKKPAHNGKNYMYTGICVKCGKGTSTVSKETVEGWKPKDKPKDPRVTTKQEQ